MFRLSRHKGNTICMLPQERIYKNGSTAHNACYGAVKSNTPPPLLLDILHSWQNVRCLSLYGRSCRNYSFNLPMACSCRNYNHLNYEKTCIPISQFLFTLCFACWGDRQVPPNRSHARFYNASITPFPLPRRAIYTPLGSDVMSMLAVVAPCLMGCATTTRPVVSYSVMAS